MQRFLAIVGHPEQLASCKERALLHGFVPVEMSPGAILCVSHPEQLIPVGDHQGAVIGTLFDRYGAPRPISVLKAADASAILATRGRHLIERFWGSYVAILSSTDGYLVLRDPSGMAPCHFTEKGGLYAFGSDPEILMASGFARGDIDWFQLARSLLLQGLPAERSALRGIHDLLPGTSLIFHNGNVTKQMLWNPWDHVIRSHSANPDADSEHLGRTVQNCISSWGQARGAGIAGISGGLDSSIVAACLKRAGKLESGLTLVTTDPLGDERHYCRMLTNHVGVPLSEAHYSLDDISLDRSAVSHRPRPFGRLDAPAYDAAATRAAKEQGVSAFYTGNGGDNVFYLSRSARALADRYVVEGGCFGLARTARDIVALTGANILQVIKLGVRALRLAHSEYVWHADNGYLSSEVIRDQLSAPVQHPWLELPSGGGLPGKAAHIAMLMRMLHSVEGYVERDGVAIVHPLVSQPIVELCLAIPSWLQCKGGLDRAIARDAFTKVLPAEIIFRRGKGSPQSFIYEIFRRFQSQIRERLLDGSLVAESILDRRMLEAALAPTAQKDSFSMLRLSLLVDTEAWITHWRAEAGKSVPNEVRMRHTEGTTTARGI